MRIKQIVNKKNVKITKVKTVLIVLLFLPYNNLLSQCKPIEKSISIKKRERLERKCARKKRRQEKKARKKLIKTHRKRQSKEVRKRMKKNRRRDRKRKKH